MKCHDGIVRRSLVFLFTGVYIQYQHLVTNGMQGICISRGVKSMSIILKLMVSIKNLAIRTLFLCSRGKSLMRRSGLIYLKQQVQGMWCQWQNTMMDFKCIRVNFQSLMHMKWGHSVISWEN